MSGFRVPWVWGLGAPSSWDEDSTAALRAGGDDPRSSDDEAASAVEMGVSENRGPYNIVP